MHVKLPCSVWIPDHIWVQVLKKPQKPMLHRPWGPVFQGRSSAFRKHNKISFPPSRQWRTHLESSRAPWILRVPKLNPRPECKSPEDPSAGGPHAWLGPRTLRGRADLGHGCDVYNNKWFPWSPQLIATCLKICGQKQTHTHTHTHTKTKQQQTKTQTKKNKTR